MKNLFLLAVSMTTAFVFAQQKTPNVIPPSPEASSVFKFTEVPVSLYTGLPNITIPLFEIESGGVKVPISISYHARGIKVAEIASRVGLGWALNCGGMLSRQTRDDADSSTLYTANFNGFFETEQKRIDLLNYFDTYGDVIDFIPDQYYFNVNGLSGKFVHDYTTGKRVMQQFTNIKFDQDSNLVDDKGNKYTFQAGDYENVANNYEFIELNLTNDNIPAPVSQPTIINTSHLGKITTQTGSEILFNYNVDNSWFGYMRRNYDAYDSSEQVPQYKSYAARVKSYQKRLMSISYDNGFIEFQYIDRQDNGDYALNNIIVKDKNMHVIKIISFTYDVVTSPLDGNTHPHYLTTDPAANKRMYLRSVQFRHLNQQALPPYTFEYSEIPLPNRHSNSQDVWGYYNGKNNGWMLKNSTEYTTAGARSVDTIASEAGMLKKIIYPEGGYTKFYYEHNKVYNYFPKTVDFGDPNPIIYHETGLSHLDHSNSTLFNGNTFHRTIVIPQSVTGAVKYSLEIDGSSEGCGNPYNSGTCKFITSISNGTVSYNLYKTAPGQTQDIYLTPGTYTLRVVYQGPLPYTPTLGTADDFTDNNNFRVILRWGETGPADGPMYAGGKRIQKIENFDPVTGQTLTKTYNYNEPGSTQTSGRLLGLPNFRFIANSVQMLGGATYNVYSHFGNVPGSPLSTYQEQSVGYGTVTEYTGEGNNVLGKTVHTFTMTPDGGDYYTFPYHPPADNEWLRGKELTATYYKKNLNGSFTTIKKVENEYLYGGSTDPLEILGNITYRGLIGQGLEDCGDPNAPGPPIQCLNFAYIKNSRQFRLPLALFYYPSANFYDPIKYKAYTLTGGTMDLGQTTVTDYFEGGLQLVSNTKYKYRYDNHYNVSEEEQTKSTGTAVTKYFYASDPEMAGKPARQALIDNNIVAAPLVTQSFRGINKISEIETVFKDWGGFLAPEVVKTSKGDFGLEERLIYTKMDPVNGNILEVKQANGILISYVWGYNNQYPIAKLENCAYSTIPIAILNDLKVMSNADNDNWFSTVATNEDNLNNRLKDLRAALPDALVTTLTYDPLIGVTRSTDARGNCIKYKYDRFGRLIAVIDHEGKILSETEYHYQN